MAERRLPRVDLDKLTSRDPAQRRPAVDLLGASLCRHGAVRVLADEAIGSLALAGIGLTLIAGVELYFGLPPGRLGDRITVEVSDSLGEEQAWVARISRGLPVSDGSAAQTYQIKASTARTEVAVEGAREGPQDASTSLVPWSPRGGEVLMLAGPALALWTGGVVAMGSVAPDESRVPTDPSPHSSEVLEFGTTLWSQSGDVDRLGEFGPS